MMGARKPKIAYFIADPQLCGGISVVCQHANRLRRRGFDVCIVSTAGADRIEWFPNQSVPVYPLKKAPEGLDIGVATWWETTHVLARTAIPRKFYFVQSDETRFYPEGRFERLFARASYRLDLEFLTEARWIRRWLAEEFGREAAYVPNGIDLELFRADTPREPKGTRSRVLIEGPADMPTKGIEEAFRALHGVDCEIWYVNYRGEPSPSWKPDRYFYQVPMDEMRGIYSSCDILLKLSTVEGASGPPLEMMACGGVCVVGRVTGADEALQDGVNALLVDAGDLDGATEAVRRLIGDGALRERLAAGGRETVTRLDWERSIDTLEGLFLSPPPGPTGTPGEREAGKTLVDAYRMLREMERGHADQVKVMHLSLRSRAEDIAALNKGLRASAGQVLMLEEELKQREGEIASLRAELESLRRERDELLHQLNSLRASKAWKIGEACMKARRSPMALLALPAVVAKAAFGRSRPRFPEAGGGC